MQDVKNGVIQYAPEAYSLMQSKFKAKGTLDKEVLKMLSLSPESLARKIQGMSQCLVDRGMLKKNEANMIANVFSSYAVKDVRGTRASMNKIVSSGSSSEFMQVIVNGLKEVGIGRADSPHTTAQSQNNSDNWDKAIDIMIGVGVVAGAIVGAIIGGLAGAAAGAGLGSVIMKAVGKTLKAIFGKKKGFMPGPNGENCEPPFLVF